MAVPAHDSRDYAFATHFGIEKKVIIQPPVDWDFADKSFDEKEGKLVNSDFLNGLDVKAAIKKVIAVIEEKGLGKGKTNFRLRDAIFGRQRYWGEPIPVYYKSLSPALSEGEGETIPCVVDEADLPIMLPEVDKYLPTETGEPPLARAKDWKYRVPTQPLSGFQTLTAPCQAGQALHGISYATWMLITTKLLFQRKLPHIGKMWICIWEGQNMLQVICCTFVSGQNFCMTLD
jgi:leucyl-tRNA synthetase